jgi:hypothetical protein
METKLTLHGKILGVRYFLKSSVQLAIQRINKVIWLNEIDSFQNFPKM